PYTSKGKHEMQGELDALKMSLEKAYIGDTRLVTILKGLGKQVNRFRGRLIVDFRGEAQELRTSGAVDTHHMLWLITERSINAADLRHSGREEYIVCYDQLVRNENDFHVFNEN